MQHVGIFTAINSDGATQGLLPAAFALRTVLTEQFMDRYFPAQAVDEPTVADSHEHARLAAGEYSWSRQQQGDFQEGLALIGRFLALKPTIRARDDGTIETNPALTLQPNGRVQVWREVRPFVWREVGGRAHLLMKMQGGQVQAIWTDALPSFWINLRVPTSQSAGLNVPLLLAATAVLLLTVVLWPVATLVRKRYGATLQLSGSERSAYLWSRVAALVGMVYMFAWLIAMVADLASTEGARPWIRLIQLDRPGLHRRYRDRRLECVAHMAAPACELGSARVESGAGSRAHVCSVVLVRIPPDQRSHQLRPYDEDVRGGPPARRLRCRARSGNVVCSCRGRGFGARAPTSRRLDPD